MTDLTVVRWCALCNKTRAEGTLRVYEEDLQEEMDLPSCIPCKDAAFANENQLALFDI